MMTFVILSLSLHSPGLPLPPPLHPRCFHACPPATVPKTPAPSTLHCRLLAATATADQGPATEGTSGAGTAAASGSTALALEKVAAALESNPSEAQR
eukprot:2828281-Pleurochrysis_carterae.AAC.2